MIDYYRTRGMLDDPSQVTRIEYDNYIYDDKKGKIPTNDTTVCYFKKDDPDDPKTRGILPNVLNHLLNQRNATKKRMKKEKDEFKYKLLDGLQLAYKVTANICIWPSRSTYKCCLQKETCGVYHCHWKSPYRRCEAFCR